MLTFLARMKAKEGKEEEFIRLATELTEKVIADEPGVVTYQFYRLRDEERGFGVIEAFVDDAAEELRYRGRELQIIFARRADPPTILLMQ